VGSRSKARARAQASQPAGQRAQVTRKPATAASSAGPAAAVTQASQPLVPARAGRASVGPPAAEPGLSPAAAGPDPQTPRTVLGLAVVELVEVAGILMAAILAGVATASGKSYQLGSGIAITVIGVGVALALGFVVRGLRSGRRWARTPTLLTQLFVGIVGIYLTQGGRYDWGIPALVLAITGFGLLLAPASIRVLTPGRTDPPSPR
jgi:hypothetical protein